MKNILLAKALAGSLACVCAWSATQEANAAMYLDTTRGSSIYAGIMNYDTYSRSIGSLPASPTVMISLSNTASSVSSSNFTHYGLSLSAWHQVTRESGATWVNIGLRMYFTVDVPTQATLSTSHDVSMVSGRPSPNSLYMTFGNSLTDTDISPGYSASTSGSGTLTQMLTPGNYYYVYYWRSLGQDPTASVSNASESLSLSLFDVPEPSSAAILSLIAAALLLRRR